MTAEHASRQEVLAVMTRIAARELELSGPIALDQRLVADLELDSMGLTIMAVGLENHFRIKLDEDDGPRLVTVADVVALVERRIDEREASTNDEREAAASGHAEPDAAATVVPTDEASRC